MNGSADKKTGVDAVFAGRRLRFELRRDAHAVVSLEAAIGSPFAAFLRFGTGAWSMTDVRMVLSHAYPGATLLHRLTRVAVVEAAIEAKPATTYAWLAQKTLEAFLMGLDPALATFDEADPLPKSMGQHA
jgi:hypothetical protein